jgi:hypothetical protein
MAAILVERCQFLRSQRFSVHPAISFLSRKNSANTCDDVWESSKIERDDVRFCSTVFFAYDVSAFRQNSSLLSFGNTPVGDLMSLHRKSLAIAVIARINTHKAHGKEVLTKSWTLS